MLTKLGKTIRHHAVELKEYDENYQEIIDSIGDARFVFLGEATHGTHEFYKHRAEISKRLIATKGFNAIAVEADWPDACRCNRYIRRRSDDRSALEALNDFTRFPLWMWRNQEVVEFIEDLRQINSARSLHDEVGFYGLDLYSLYASIDAVIAYLQSTDPGAAKRAVQRYQGFEGFRERPQQYGFSSLAGITASAEDAAVKQLLNLYRKRFEYLEQDGISRADAHFCAEQNARLVISAERYYRAMFHEGVSTWNLRDTHMFQTLESLASHLSGTRTAEAKIIVWAHNSHSGDARATQAGRRGELNIGQLARMKYGNNSKLLGFTTSIGSVAAASSWDGEVEIKRVRPPLNESYEKMLSDAHIPQFFLPLNGETSSIFSEPKLERMIGVLYLPETERWSHYNYADITKQFDGIIHCEETTPVKPLDSGAVRNKLIPETFPSGL